jgi:hypothetical protein
MLQVGASTRQEASMTDLIYIAGGIAVLALYALYAVALRRV